MQESPHAAARTSLDRAGSLLQHSPLQTPMLSWDSAEEPDEFIPLVHGEVPEAPPSLAQAVEELGKLAHLAGPIVLQQTGSIMLLLICNVFVGHLDNPVELSAVVLASSIFNVTGNAILIGFGSAMDTLCGQAYGAENYELLGQLLQRAQAVGAAIAVPLMLLWTQIGPLLRAVGQPPELARLTARVLHLLIPNLVFTVLMDTQRRYLTAQRVVRPTMIFALLTTTLALPTNYLFIYRLGMRTDGAALAAVVCQGTLALMLTVYRVMRDRQLRGTPHQTWHGYKASIAFSGWGPYIRFAIPAAAMICLEWWVWELLIVMAGWLPNAEVAVGVQGLAMQISSIFYMVPSSIGSACSTRVSNALGAGRPAAAALVARVAATATFASIVTLAVATWAARRLLVGAFTSDEQVINQTSDAMPAVVASYVGDGMTAVFSGVMRAAGHQTVGAALNLAAYWGLGLPLAYLLGFRANLQVTGFWAAIATAAGLQSIVFGLYVFCRLDWHVEVKRAQVLQSQHLVQRSASWEAEAAAAAAAAAEAAELEGRAPLLASGGASSTQGAGALRRREPGGEEGGV